VTTARKRWAGTTADERQADRRRRLLDAALDIVGTDGLSGVTVREVCRRAELNPRYFYENFDTPDDVLGALHDRLYAEAAQRTIGHLDGVPDGEVVRTVMTATFAHLADDPRRARVLFGDSTQSPVLAARRRDAVGLLIRTIAPSSSLASDEVSPTDTVVSAMIAGAVSELGLSWSEGRLGDDLNLVIDKSTSVMESILAHADILDGIHDRAVGAATSLAAD